MDFKQLLSTTEYSFLKTNPRLAKRIILLGVGGSYAYGTNNENSDIDFRGITLNLPSDILGLTEFEQYEDDKTDTVIYSFNKIVRLLLDCNPNTIEILGIDEDKYVQSAPRNQRWENTIDGSIKQSPWGQTITFDMAKAAIEGENLGHNPAGVADMITVSISSTDMIGHRISPNSIWMQDTYLRLDRDIADFLSFLDQKVGKGNYIIFLSADHGGSHNTEFRSEHSLPAETWKTALVKEELETKLHERFPQYAKIVESLSNMQVHLSKEVRSGSQVDEISQAAAQILAKRNEVAYAFPFSNIPQFVPEPIRTMAINGYCPQRSGEVCIIFQPRIIEDYASISELQKPDHIYKGTTHSLWNPDDTHIPLIFMGWHIPHAWDNQTHYICDIAATLASLLNIQQPNACVGENIIK